MNATLYNFLDDGTREDLAIVTIFEGTLSFIPRSMAEHIIPVVMDADGPVPVTEPERFIRAIPQSFSGSRIRAEIVEE